MLDIRNFKKHFDSLRRHDSYTVFNDFCEITAISLSNSVDKTQFNEREQRYLDIAKKYTKDELLVYAQMFAELVRLLEQTDHGDVLGDIYMQLGISSKELGQVFTPYSVSKLIARLNFDKKLVEEQISKQGYITLYDPCVGAGGLVVAAAEVMQDKGFNFQKQLKVIVGDISRTAVHMSYVQLSLLGIDAVVRRENALSQECSEVWYTPLHILHLNEDRSKKQWEKIFKKIPNKIPNKIDTNQAETKEAEQLTLF